MPPPRRRASPDHRRTVPQDLRQNPRPRWSLREQLPVPLLWSPHGCAKPASGAVRIWFSLRQFTLGLVVPDAFQTGAVHLSHGVLPRLAVGSLDAVPKGLLGHGTCPDKESLEIRCHPDPGNKRG